MFYYVHERDAATFLSCTLQQLRRLRKTKRLLFFEITPGDWCISYDDLKRHDDRVKYTKRLRKDLGSGKRLTPAKSRGFSRLKTIGY